MYYTRRVRLGPFLVILLACTGCENILGIDDLVADRGPDGGAGGSSSTGPTGGGGTSGTCADVCGTPGFADTVSDLLMDLGVPASNIRVERFGPSS